MYFKHVPTERAHSFYVHVYNMKLTDLKIDPPGIPKAIGSSSNGTELLYVLSIIVILGWPT